MKLWQWQEGRQVNCSYKKLPLWYFRVWKWGFDGYVLKYQGDTILPAHTDPVAGRHYRLNIGWGCANLVVNRTIIYWRIGKLTVILFRPDLYVHTLFVFGKTTKLSLGFVKFD